MLADDKPHDECGVFGMFGHKDAALLTYYSLFALQHRGQEAAGIASVEDGQMYSHRGLGLLGDVFAGGELDGMLGTAAIGHVRYSTAGSNTVQNAQPITVRTHQGNLAMAHNGNLVNAHVLRKRLEESGSLFQSTSDTEVVLHLIARGREATLVDNIRGALQQIRGGYSLVFLSDRQLIAVRDLHGLRPLCLGQLDEGYVFASESCAFETIGATFLRDVDPGEMIVIDQDGVRSEPIWPRVGVADAQTSPRRAMCTFEHIYFARPDSDIDGWNVHAVRKQLGRVLAERHGVPADIVIGVPDSSISAASGYAEASGVPFEMGLVKNKYIARTFIQPSQVQRDLGVRLKLNPVQSVVQGKRVVLVDDSIVRGTTIRRIVAMLREAGASEIHVRISSPPYRHACHYGIDTSTSGQLAAAVQTVDEIRRDTGADSLEFLTVDELMSAFGLQPGNGAYPFCNACFTGAYPTEVYAVEKLQNEAPLTAGR
ncbi:amidophosphoribosyltransferase [Alicyclobacillus sp. ALC3]|uniref:amidophosphoribosyltransferase n=1 Tax=Alicyclobacillus sp. ALC3 TaxID=2796143 RepID=UPI002379A7DA|nr:amidophosphoribosyltransferase [Alicyclobacillus sp. ALC3]WDL99498.1 amidophosphoribosyltransferase [Alicyclobacillus sp. ALC3]